MSNSNTTTIVRYTTAPSDYDSFGITGRVIGRYNGKELRCVEVPQEHAEWYSQRCGSGLYPVFDVEELNRLILDGRVEPNEVDERVSDEPTDTEAETQSPKADLPRVSSTVAKYYHDKRQKDYWLVVPSERVERAEFEALRDECQSRDGWYSRKWAKIPGGFAFDNLKDAEQFQTDIMLTIHDVDEPVAGVQYKITGAPASKPSPYVKITPAMRTRAKRFRTMANKVSGDIAALRGDHLENTPKRQRQAVDRRNKANLLERVALALLSLADKIDANELTPELATFKNKLAIESALVTQKRLGEYGYVDTYEFSKTDSESVALQSVIDVDTLNGSAQSKDAKADADNFVRNCDVPGYFPTPTATADDLITEADLGAESVSVLEPSAGDGAIANRIRQLWPHAQLTCVESNHQLATICRENHGTIEADFLTLDTSRFDPAKTSGFDRVVMNPPYEKRQWFAHVVKAFALLKPGGRLVALLPATAERDEKFNGFLLSVSDRTESHQWIDYGQPFKNALKPTGVSCVCLVLERSKAETVEAETVESTALVTTQCTDVATDACTEVATVDAKADEPQPELPEKRQASFLVDRLSFRKAMDRLADTAPRKSAKTVLTSVKVSVNGHCRLSAFDLERWHDEDIQAEHDGDSELLVNAAKLKQVVAKSRSDFLKVELWDRSLRVAGAIIPQTEIVDEFPSADGMADGEFDVIAEWNGSAHELSSMLGRTYYACDNESSRYALGACLVELSNESDDDRLTIVATDGRRLAVARHGNDIETDKRQTCLLAYGFAKSALKSLNLADTATLSITRDRDPMRHVETGEILYHKENGKPTTRPQYRADVIRLDVRGAYGSTSYIFRQVDGRFPEWRDVIPNAELTAEVDAKALWQFSDTVKSATGEESRGVDFTFGSDRMSAFVDNESGQLADSIPAKTFGDKLTITLDGRFVSEFAKSVNKCGESVRILATDAEKPVVMQADNVLCVVMPLCRDKAKAK